MNVKAKTTGYSQEEEGWKCKRDCAVAEKQL